MQHIIPHNQRSPPAEYHRGMFFDTSYDSREVFDYRRMRDELEKMSEGVSRRLRAAGVVAGTIAIKLRYADFTTLTRQKRLASPTDEVGAIHKVAVELWQGAWQRGRAVRLLGVAGQQLDAAGQLPDPSPIQLALF